MSNNKHQNTSKILAIIILSISLLRVNNTSILVPDIDFRSTSLNSASTGFTIKGASVNSCFGYQVARAGDTNNDGFDDIIIGAFGCQINQGKVYVIYGKPNFSLSEIDLSSTSLDPTTTGFTITGDNSLDWAGHSVSSAGDINNDGFDDIIVGAPYRESQKGIVYIIFGKDNSQRTNLDISTATSLNPLTTGFSIKGHSTWNSFGYSVRKAGDINKDGFEDIIIGAFSKDNYQGAAYVIYGQPNSFPFANLDLSSVSLNPSSTGFRISGQAQLTSFGYSVSTAGDINNDGYADLIIGAYQTDNKKGAAYVIYGRPTLLLGNIDLSSPTTTLDPASTGFIIRGNSAGDGLGTAVNTAGDINGDGYDDILIGAHFKNSQQGEVYVIYGGHSFSRSNIDLSSQSLDPKQTGITLVGSAVNDIFGVSVSTTGDINQDGYDDIIIGAEYGNKVYVIYGGSTSSRSNINLSSQKLDFGTTGFTLIGNVLGNRLGRSVSTAGDINGDGYPDLIVGAFGVDFRRGVAYVIYGVCLIPHCNLCSGRQSCESCDNGYFLINAKCESCPSNCKKCQNQLSCEVCEDDYFLYQTQCVSPCLSETVAALSTSGHSICEDCPKYCLSCTSSKTCNKCWDGYRLSNSLCFLSPSSSLEGITLQKATSAVSYVGSILSAGSSIFSTSGLVSKIVQNMRYIETIVTDDLQEIYLNWGTSLFSWDFPGSPSYSSYFTSPPGLFDQYDLESSFLANFWTNWMLVIGGLVISMTCGLLKRIMEKEQIQGLAYSLADTFASGFMNFAIVQVYGGLDDIVFYLILDIKTNRFNSVFSWTSVITASIFTVIGTFLILVNYFIVHKYQTVKNDIKQLDAFNKKYTYLQLLYSDFNDTNSWTQSFFAFMIMRNILSSIVIGALSRSKLLQMLILILADGIILTFLILKTPLLELKEQLAHYYFETITLCAHICVLILCIRDLQGYTSNDRLRTRVCQAIIYLNAFLIAGCVGFMFIEIYRSINKRCKQRKRHQNTSANAAIQEDSNTENARPNSNPKNQTREQQLMIDTSHPVSLTSGEQSFMNETNQLEKNAQFERRREPDNIQQNTYLRSRFTAPNHNGHFLEINQANRPYFYPDNSFIHDARRNQILENELIRPSPKKRIIRRGRRDDRAFENTKGFDQY